MDQCHLKQSNKAETFTNTTEKIPQKPKEKHYGAPIRGQITAVFLYINDQRTRFKKANPGFSKDRLSKLMKSVWNTKLSTKEKEPYVLRVNQNYQHYQQQREIFLKSNQYKQYQADVANWRKRYGAKYRAQQAIKLNQMQQSKRTKTGNNYNKKKRRFHQIATESVFDVTNEIQSEIQSAPPQKKQRLTVQKRFQSLSVKHLNMVFNHDHEIYPDMVKYAQQTVFPAGICRIIFDFLYAIYSGFTVDPELIAPSILTDQTDCNLFTIKQSDNVPLHLRQFIESTPSHLFSNELISSDDSFRCSIEVNLKWNSVCCIGLINHSAIQNIDVSRLDSNIMLKSFGVGMMFDTKTICLFSGNETTGKELIKNIIPNYNINNGNLCVTASLLMCDNRIYFAINNQIIATKSKTYVLPVAVSAYNVVIYGENSQTILVNPNSTK